MLPALAVERGGVAGMVLVDALLPHPGRSWAQTVPESFATRLRAGAVGGRLPPWPQWWGEERMRELRPRRRRSAPSSWMPARRFRWR